MIKMLIQEGEHERPVFSSGLWPCASALFSEELPIGNRLIEGNENSLYSSHCSKERQLDIMILNNPLLHQYWFKTKRDFGIGITAYSLDDARAILAGTTAEYLQEREVETIIEDVDISQLDRNHVIPNMGPPNLRGIWYPRLNV